MINVGGYTSLIESLGIDSYGLTVFLRVSFLESIVGMRSPYEQHFYPLLMHLGARSVDFFIWEKMEDSQKHEQLEY